MMKPRLRWALLAGTCVLACSSNDDQGTGSPSGSDGTTVTTGVDSSCPEGDAQLCGMVAAHNAARAKVSPVPTTALPSMVWDATVAAEAQAWADQCTFSHSADGYGQNIYASTGDSAPTTEAVVVDWIREAADYDYATNSCSNVCGHYTQVVWRDSTKVGCGLKACSTGSPFDGYPNWYLVVCDYSPPGNHRGELPY